MSETSAQYIGDRQMVSWLSRQSFSPNERMMTKTTKKAAGKAATKPAPRANGKYAVPLPGDTVTFQPREFVTRGGNQRPSKEQPRHVGRDPRMVVLNTRTDEDRHNRVILSQRTWSRIVQLAKAGGFAWRSPSGWLDITHGRELLEMLSSRFWDLREQDDRDGLDQVIALLKRRLGLVVRDEHGNSTSLSVG